MLASKDPKKEPKPKDKINLEDLRQILILAEGGDPEAQRWLNKFLKTESPQERSFFPSYPFIQRQVYLLAGSKVFFKDEEGNPLKMWADLEAEVFNGYKGKKSDQVVEMLKKGTDLGNLTLTPQMQAPQQKSKFLSRKPKDEFE